MSGGGRRMSERCFGRMAEGVSGRRRSRQRALLTAKGGGKGKGRWSRQRAEVRAKGGGEGKGRRSRQAACAQ